MRNVLILDDDPLVCQTVETMLKVLGYKTQSTTAPNSFVARAKDDDFDFLILDLMMPVMNGEEVTSRLADAGVSTPLILMSGGDSNLLKSAALSAEQKGLSTLGVLRKPFFIHQLQVILDRVHEYHSIVIDEKPRQRFSANDILMGLGRDEFYCVYQPKVSLPTREPEGLEVLLRWNHPKFGDVSPASFIASAEQENVIAELTQFVILASLEWFTKLQGVIKLNALSLAINISAQVINQRWLDVFLTETCRRFGLEPTKIILEITESTTLDQHADVLKRLLSLRLKGFRLSLDDFGTGYSSLQQLIRLPLSELKIDKSFVLSNKFSDESKQIIRTTVDLAQSLNLKTVAEGVEDEETAEYLQGIGCDTLQGFFFSLPLTSDEMESWLLEKMCDFNMRRMSLARAIIGRSNTSVVNFSYISHFIQYFLRFDVALVSIVEREKVFVTSPAGIEESIIDLDESLCQFVMRNNRVTIFDNIDSLPGLKERLAPAIRAKVNFYAGFPLFNNNGLCIGSLCAIHRSPRRLSDQVLDTLDLLARLVEFEIHHFIESSKREHLAIDLEEERFKRLVDVANSLGLAATLVRVTENPKRNLCLDSLLASLKASVQPWDYVSSLNTESAFVLLLHPAGEIPIEFVIQRLEVAIKGFHTKYDISMSSTETSKNNDIQSLFGNLQKLSLDTLC